MRLDGSLESHFCGSYVVDTIGQFSKFSLSTTVADSASYALAVRENLYLNLGKRIIRIVGRTDMNIGREAKRGGAKKNPNTGLPDKQSRSLNKAMNHVVSDTQFREYMNRVWP